MAGQPGRSGGDRPTAPQNNPANVKPLGGNGQSGRYSGFAYGQNKALAEQQAAAPIKPAPSFNAGSARMGEERSMRPVTPITAETELPNQPVTDGVPVGAGANSIPGLPMGPTSGYGDEQEINMIRDYYPMLEFWASQPGTSQSTKDYVQYLRTII